MTRFQVRRFRGAGNDDRPHPTLASPPPISTAASRSSPVAASHRLGAPARDLFDEGQAGVEEQQLVVVPEAAREFRPNHGVNRANNSEASRLASAQGSNYAARNTKTTISISKIALPATCRKALRLVIQRRTCPETDKPGS